MEEQKPNKDFQEVVFLLLSISLLPVLLLCVIIDTIRNLVSIGSRLTIYEVSETAMDFIFWLATEIDDLRKLIWMKLKDLVRKGR
jgi:hypothetical protein